MSIKIYILIVITILLNCKIEKTQKKIDTVLLQTSNIALKYQEEELSIDTVIEQIQIEGLTEKKYDPRYVAMIEFKNGFFQNKLKMVFENKDDFFNLKYLTPENLIDTELVSGEYDDIASVSSLILKDRNEGCMRLETKPDKKGVSLRFSLCNKKNVWYLLDNEKKEYYKALGSLSYDPQQNLFIVKAYYLDKEKQSYTIKIVGHHKLK